MKEIYYENNGQQTGPINIDDLKPLQINGETLVWYEGLSEWTKAKNISDLNDYFSKLPPPLPARQNIKENLKFDLTYEKETDALTVGIALFLTPFFLKLIGVFNIDNEQSFRTAQAVLALVALIIRIAVTLWVTAIAKRQNRNTTGWGFFAFFLPSVSLIIIGLLRRLRIEGQLTFAELKKEVQLDNRTAEQKKIDDEKFKRQDNLLRIIVLTMIIGGFAALFAIMFFWQ